MATPLDDHRRVQCVVELVAWDTPDGVSTSIALGTRARVDGAVRVAAGGGADAELEVLRRRLEAACLVGAEAVLPGEHHGEPPARGRRAAERGLRHA